MGPELSLANLYKRIVYPFVLEYRLLRSVGVAAVVDCNVINTPLCKLRNVLLFVSKHPWFALAVGCRSVAAAVLSASVGVRADLDLPRMQIIHHCPVPGKMSRRHRYRACQC